MKKCFVACLFIFASSLSATDANINSKISNKENAKMSNQQSIPACTVPNYDSVILDEPNVIFIVPFSDYMIANYPPKLRFRDGMDFAKWQKEGKAKLAELLLVDKMFAAPKVDLAPRTLWKKDFPFGTVEKIVVTTEAGVDMPMYFCLPHGATGKLPAFICLQGHSTGMHKSIGVEFTDETTPLVIDGDRDFAVQCVKRGFAALCIEQRAFGERSGNPDHKPNCRNIAPRLMMHGRTTIGCRVFDVDRGIDYLLTRPEIDAKQIGVMGNSGGGTTSIYAGALLDRLSFVMPSSCFSTYYDSIIRQYHCICNYAPGLQEYFDMGDIAGLCAPKLLVIVNGKDDRIFPLGAAKNEFAQAEKIYRASGNGNNCRHVIGHEGHRFYAEPAFAAFQEIRGK